MVTMHRLQRDTDEGAPASAWDGPGGLVRFGFESIFGHAVLGFHSLAPVLRVGALPVELG